VVVGAVVGSSVVVLDDDDFSDCDSEVEVEEEVEEAEGGWEVGRVVDAELWLELVVSLLDEEVVVAAVVVVEVGA
jgi:hypothetical protein